MIRFSVGLVLLVALAFIVAGSFAVVGGISSEYDLRGASAVQITQVYSEGIYGLLQNVFLLLALMAFLQIGKFASKGLKRE